MSYKVAPSLDYANFKIDYKAKKVDLSYPHKSSKVEEFFIFFIIALFPAIFLSFIITIFTDKIPYLDSFWFRFFLVVALCVGFVFFSHRTKFVRLGIMQMCDDVTETNQVYLTGKLQGKKVTINNVGNFFTGYDVLGDYALYLQTFEIKCIHTWVKRRWYGQSRKYIWTIEMEFSEIPEDGYMLIKNRRGGMDEIVGDGSINITYA